MLNDWIYLEDADAPMILYLPLGMNAPVFNPNKVFVKNILMRRR
jgi:hypothetical protein